MTIERQIEEYINAQPEPKRAEMAELHRLILRISPKCALWFLDGKDEAGKIVSNPNIGYGLQTISYADGKSREFYRIGLSANKTGLSIYVIGLEDKNYLARTYGQRIGKAKVTGYCVRFRTTKDINMDVVEDLIGFGLIAERTIE
jgi:hypothetical protein